MRLGLAGESPRLASMAHLQWHEGHPAFREDLRDWIQACSWPSMELCGWPSTPCVCENE